MAHNLTPQEIDALAAEHTAAIETPAAPPTYTTLAYGATGDCVTRLVDLLAVLGHANNTVIKGGPPVLDDSVLADVRAAQASLNVTEPELLESAAITVGVKGELIGDATWHALYTAAGIALDQEAAAGPTA
jgi:hypothetical protein